MKRINVTLVLRDSLYNTEAFVIVFYCLVAFSFFSLFFEGEIINLLWRKKKKKSDLNSNMILMMKYLERLHKSWQDKIKSK